MSQVGYYRFKMEGLVKGRQSVVFYSNGAPLVTHTVNALEQCAGWIQLKWLDNNGQYRFFPFIELYKIKDTAKQIGETSNYITSLLESQTDSKNIGQTTDRTMTLRAINVTKSERAILASLGNSPRVYMYVGNYTTDDMANYIEVTVKTDGIVRSEKQLASMFEVTITLPKYNNVTMM